MEDIMFLITISIPTTSNEGETFTPEHHKGFEAIVVNQFGGLTRRGETVSGMWRDGDRTYCDVNIEYLIAVGSITDGAKLKMVVEFAKRHYRQEAIFISYLGVAEIL
jgi:hypothetical protein